MQITGKNLLSSAESLLRDRREKPLRSASPEAPRTESGSIQAGAMQARLVHLQGRLSGEQHEFSREQARLAFLDSPDGELQNLLFDGKPLFPEGSTAGLRQKVMERLEGLERNLRTMQVEMENMAALGVLPTSEFNPEDLNRAMGHLDPKRVSRLTR
jgi:hypothetical protein